MESVHLLHLLFFIFGYVTCKTFYFISSTRKSILLLQATQVVALFIIVRALESFSYAKQYRVDTMEKNNASEQNIEAFKLRHNDEVAVFRNKSITKIIETHGPFFNQTVEFNDWKTAMAFLEKNKESVISFITQD